MSQGYELDRDLEVVGLSGEIESEVENVGPSQEGETVRH
jgi:hypothetical protein